MINILAQTIEEKLHEDWKAKIYENAEIVEKTPASFFLKGLFIFAIVVGFTLFVRNYARRKK